MAGVFLACCRVVQPSPLSECLFIVDAIRYRPGEAVRWLESGAQAMRKSAARKGKGIVRREGHRSLGKDIKEAAGAIYDMGRSAFAELAHHQAMASEYVLGEESFEVIRSGSSRTYRYADITGLEQKGDRLMLTLDQGSITIKPHAYIVAGRIRVPVGWVRNGIEVPYAILLDEIAARCGKDVVFR
mgnify:CR=1 FL=1